VPTRYAAREPIAQRESIHMDAATQFAKAVNLGLPLKNRDAQIRTVDSSTVSGSRNRCPSGSILPGFILHPKHRCDVRGLVRDVGNSVAL
jgi:hypothetical protein